MGILCSICATFSGT